MKQQSIRQSLCFWQSIRDEKPIVETHLNRDLISLDMSFKGPLLIMKFHLTIIAQTFRERGNRHEQLRGMVYNQSISKLEDINIKFARDEEWMSGVTRETDRRSCEMCTSISKFIDEQHDIRKVVEDLAQQVEAIKNGTHPKSTSAGSSCAPKQATPEAGVPALLEIEDLKRKVARLTEQVTKIPRTSSASAISPSVA